MGLFDPIKDGQDVTREFIQALAAVSLFLGVMLILFMLWQIIFPSPRVSEARALWQNEQVFARLQAARGAAASRTVVYEEGHRLFYYLDGRKVEIR